MAVLVGKTAPDFSAVAVMGNNEINETFNLKKYIAGKYAVMNLIPCNAADGLGFRRPAPERAEAMSLALYRRGILTKLRQSAGQDIDGGCGQLRARTIARQPRAALSPEN